MSFPNQPEWQLSDIDSVYSQNQSIDQGCPLKAYESDFLFLESPPLMQDDSETIISPSRESLAPDWSELDNDLLTKMMADYPQKRWDFFVPSFPLHSKKLLKKRHKTARRAFKKSLPEKCSP